MALKKLFKTLFQFLRKCCFYTARYIGIAYKWLRSRTKRELKNYSLNLVSCLLILSVFFTTLFSGGYDLWANFDIYSSKKIANNIRNLELNMTSVIYVKNETGNWEEYKRVHGDENRIWISLKKMPKMLQNAFIAIEDEDFHKHHGVDWQRTFMAVANQFLKFSSVDFGASTITQQLVKNITSDNEKVYKRKIREIVRALFVEAELSKKEILEAYLNTIALGNGINGVQVAANYYFNKEVSELTLAECAAIAAITKNPSRYNPVTNMEENIDRRRVVLTKMYELGYISNKELQEAYYEEVELDFSKKETLDSEINDYFVDTLIEQVIEDLTQKYECDSKIASQMFYNGGFKIYSTMNIEVQSAMEEVYKKESRYFYETRRNDEGERERVQSAMTIMDYSGHIVGVVGGTGEKTVNRGLNRALVPRQPGSTMKPLGVYAQAIENDIVDYTSTVLDKPVKNYYSYGKWGPREWFGEYLGKVPLNYALRRSMNAVPVRLLDKVGIDESYKFLTKNLNFKHLVKEDKNASSLALGGCTYGITPTESAAAFAIFGNGGMYYKPTTYYKIVDIDGNVILEEDKKGKRAISESTATIMNHLLREVVYKEGGTGRTVGGFNYRMKAYAKTGTSSDTKDSWLVGGTPYYVGSVWYGFDHNFRVYNTNAAKTIWRDIMRVIHKDLEVKTFEDSEDVYRKGDGYYKNGTKPGKVLKEEDYLPEEEKEDESKTSSKESSKNSSTEASSQESSPSSDASNVSDAQSSGETSDTSQTSSEDAPSEEKPQESEPPIDNSGTSGTQSSSSQPTTQPSEPSDIL